MEDRKRVLREHISNSERVKVVDDRVCETRKEILKAFNRFVNKGFEGVVVKPNASYEATWYKLKEQYTADLVVGGVKKTDSWRDSQIPYTFLVGIMKDGKFQQVGDVSSGLSRAEKEAIGEVVPDLRIREDSDYIYLRPEIVLEVEYHQNTEDGLREPKIKRIRYDKPVEECDSLE